MSDGYDVGYKKPPRHTRFQKGKSANPKGRPRGAKGLAASLQKIFDKQITVKESGQAKKIPLAEAVGMRLVEKALQGDPRAIKEYIVLQQRYEDTKTSGKEPPEDVKVTFTWADPFDPDKENLSYLSDDELRFLKHIMDKRNAHKNGTPYDNPHSGMIFLTKEDFQAKVREAIQELENEI